jgi:L,D-transpeptidase catalytic domain
MLKSRLQTSAGLLRSALVVAVAIVCVGSSLLAGEPVLEGSSTATAVHRRAIWEGARPGAIDQRVFELALGAANCAVQTGKIADPSTLTVIDYSQPSTKKRLWVVDLHTHELLFEELVAHGQGSGSNMATLFSNNAETHQSSIGLFETKNTYIGKNGYSLRLEGLEHGFNDHAMERAIVMHGAPYVSEAIAQTQGRLGRSWGCPALRETVARELIDRVKETGLVFAYYPDPKWLATSQFLGSCVGNPGATGVTPATIG